ncbi:hypothetical protein E2C01_003747 [Portunus trituberculatus]|uniref:Uncharacterized protein n=1 Tax=Portunus trituberculatus TaxID=210409 RepID=A0A5B7CR07_PORTR|nr:hypothetical protein [Portunus trituberculatus]
MQIIPDKTQETDLFEQSPYQSNTLKSLSKSHLISQDGSTPSLEAEAHHTLIQEHNTFLLVRTQLAGQL